MTKRKVSEYFKLIYVSAPVSYLALLIVGLIYPPAWVFLFSAFFAFVISDLILNTIIQGGKGHAKIFYDNKFVLFYYICLENRSSRD